MEISCVKLPPFPTPHSFPAGVSARLIPWPWRKRSRRDLESDAPRRLPWIALGRIGTGNREMIFQSLRFRPLEIAPLATRRRGGERARRGESIRAGRIIIPSYESHPPSPSPIAVPPIVVLLGAQSFLVGRASAGRELSARAIRQSRARLPFDQSLITFTCSCCIILPTSLSRPFSREGTRAYTQS